MENELTIIQNIIYEIRGHRVMLDSDLADLYNVEVKALNQAVKRNINRFPNDFMFQLANEEWDILRSQIVTAKKDFRKIRFMPYVFTEHGILMLSNVLNSKQATDVSISIIRVFNQLRQFALTQGKSNDELIELRKMLMLHIENTDNRLDKQDRKINKIIEVLNNIIDAPRKTKQIGFKTE